MFGNFMEHLKNLAVVGLNFELAKRGKNQI
jgi:hypothetical protein